MLTPLNNTTISNKDSLIFVLKLHYCCTLNTQVYLALPDFLENDKFGLPPFNKTQSSIYKTLNHFFYIIINKLLEHVLPMSLSYTNILCIILRTSNRRALL